jgi:hypothetical protein
LKNELRTPPSVHGRPYELLSMVRLFAFCFTAASSAVLLTPDLPKSRG